MNVCEVRAIGCSKMGRKSSVFLNLVLVTSSLLALPELDVRQCYEVFSNTMFPRLCLTKRLGIAWTVSIDLLSYPWLKDQNVGQVGVGTNIIYEHPAG